MRATNVSATFLLLATLSGAASAGGLPAGPAAGGAIIGSTVVPEASKLLKTSDLDLAGNRLQLGEAGVIVLTGEQLTTVRNALTASEGVTVEGSVIRAPTTFIDGSSGTIVLDTQSGQLMVMRN